MAAWMRMVLVAGAVGLSGCSAGLLPGLDADGPEVVAAAPDPALAGAKDRFRSGDFTGARAAFADVLVRQPANVEALVGLGATEDRLADFAAADDAYARAIAVAGRRPEILNNMGYSYYLRGDRARAREVFREAAELAPDNPVVLANLAMVSG